MILEPKSKRNGNFGKQSSHFPSHHPFLSLPITSLSSFPFLSPNLFPSHHPVLSLPFPSPNLFPSHLPHLCLPISLFILKFLYSSFFRDLLLVLARLSLLFTSPFPCLFPLHPFLYSSFFLDLLFLPTPLSLLFTSLFPSHHPLHPFPIFFFQDLLLLLSPLSFLFTSSFPCHLPLLPFPVALSFPLHLHILLLPLRISTSFPFTFPSFYSFSSPWTSSQLCLFHLQFSFPYLFLILLNSPFPPPSSPLPFV